jgi:hypothetical protein
MFIEQEIKSYYTTVKSLGRFLRWLTRTVGSTNFWISTCHIALRFQYVFCLSIPAEPLPLLFCFREPPVQISVRRSAAVAEVFVLFLCPSTNISGRHLVADHSHRLAYLFILSFKNYATNQRYVTKTFEVTPLNIPRISQSWIIVWW